MVRFVAEVLSVLQDDPRIVGVGAGGSFATGEVDVHSDLDLVVAVEPAAHAAVLAEAETLAARLGPLLVGFTGEHVGDPRLLICLYGPPLLHVDLKVVALPDLADRVEDPVILWQRDGRMGAALDAAVCCWPAPDVQWSPATTARNVSALPRCHIHSGLPRLLGVDTRGRQPQSFIEQTFDFEGGNSPCRST